MAIDRAEASRRLKAARWLAGGVDADGQAKILSNSDLARRPELSRNGISLNRLQEIEQQKTTHPPRPMELERIAVALEMPRDWFVDYSQVSDSERQREADALARQLLAGARALAQAGAQEQLGADGLDQ